MIPKSDQQNVCEEKPMADKAKTWPQNAPGPFYVDHNCIACDTCCSIAPKHFQMQAKGHSMVVQQPQNAEEAALCNEALQNCPVDAIGDDGGEILAKAG
jgi:ferredoxin